MIYKTVSILITNKMQDTYEKNSKHQIIDIHGTKYKVVHFNSSSINNKFLLHLGHIKYFIRKAIRKIKNVLVYIRDNFLIKLLHHVCEHYTDEFCDGLMVTIIMGAILFTFFTVLSEIAKLINDFKSFDNIIYKIALLIPILFAKIILISITCVFAMISSLVILYIISITLKTIRYILKSGFNILKNYITTICRQIPDVEEADALDAL